MASAIDRREGSAPPDSPAAGEVIACHECGTVHRLPAMADDTIARCTACGARIFIRFEQSRRSARWHSTSPPSASFVVANAFPIMTMSMEGQSNASHHPGQRQGALRRRHVAPRDRRRPGWRGAAAGQDPGHAGDPAATAARPAAALDRRGLPLGRAAAALGDDGGLPARRDRRLREAAGSGDRSIWAWRSIAFVGTICSWRQPMRASSRT